MRPTTEVQRRHPQGASIATTGDADARCKHIGQPCQHAFDRGDGCLIGEADAKSRIEQAIEAVGGARWDALEKLALHDPGRVKRRQIALPARLPCEKSLGREQCERLFPPGPGVSLRCAGRHQLGDGSAFREAVGQRQPR